MISNIEKRSLIVKRKVVSLLIFLCLFVLLSAEDFYLGDINNLSATQIYVPVCGANNYGWSKFFYSAAELQNAGIINPVEITRIAFQIGGSVPLVNYLMDTQSIYIGAFSGNNYTQADCVHPGYTNKALIYNGSITFNGPGWVSISLSSPYMLNPNSGVEILWENRDGSKVSPTPKFCYTESSLNKQVYKTSDDFFPATQIGSNAPKHPNICFSTADLNIPQVEIAYAGNSCLLSWNSIQGANLYAIYVADNPSGPWSFLTSITGTQYSLLADSQRKFYYIKAIGN